MGAFDMLSIANTSLGAHQTWLDALSDNIANVNTVTSTSQSAYQAKFAVFTPDANGGVDVAGFAQSSAEGIEVSSPDSPLADADGMVREPDIDMSSQMSQLIMAQRGYQSSVQVTKSAQDTYDSALSIGAK
ncbi:flagellar basal body rod protein FlgC [Nocardioides sp. Kera G14]|uniref:flagellar basal body rod protein FlgC n=1 Tax=Nocardioides sp. Kera G14 TaxID=2884264 RepID=UPI001D102B18|nr:flagellar basal body rod C-terminal domain-containing protein [Nocardioides sp. Kera G14]UDY24072.1 flagellar basal-body rod protein FlgC [Nocardioides sp. Kera G14]